MGERASPEPKHRQGVFGSGRDRFRIVVECLLRSGAKLIPFAGSAVHQATFGIKDAFAQANTRRIIEAIYQELQGLGDELPSELTPDDIDRVVDGLLAHSHVRALVEELENASATTLKALAHLTRVLARRTEDIVELAERVDSRLGLLTAVHRRREESAERFESDLMDQLRSIHERVDQVFQHLGPPSHWERAPLYLLVRQLSDCLPQAGVLVSAARRLDTAAVLLDSGRDLETTVDCSEIYAFCFSPWSLQDDEAPLLEYLFSASETPFYLLPDTIYELHGIITRRLNAFLDYRAVKKRFLERTSRRPSRQPEQGQRSEEPQEMEEGELALLAAIASESLDPYGRLKRLLDCGVLAPWPTHRVPHAMADRLRTTAMRVLASLRPGRRGANSVDAGNLAMLAALNAAAGPSGAVTCHLSRSKVMNYAAAHLARFHQEFRIPSGPWGSPILRAGPLALYVHMLRRSDRREASYLLRLAGAAKSFVLLREDALRALRDPSPAKLITLASEVASCQHALERFTDELAGFHIALSRIDKDRLGSDLRCGKDGASLVSEFDAAYERVTGILSDLLAHLQPLKEAYHPFTEIHPGSGRRGRERNAFDPE